LKPAYIPWYLLWIRKKTL